VSADDWLGDQVSGWGVPTTRQYPRTLQDAFGPHTSRQVEEPAEPPTLAGRLVGALYWAISIALFGAMFTAHIWFPIAAIWWRKHT
jgi:hypothetical protein